MIKCELEKEMHISGHVVQIAAELEMIMRDVRCAMCESLGESNGMEMYDSIIRNASISGEQRDKQCDAEEAILKDLDPELMKDCEDFVNALAERCSGGGFSSPGSVGGIGDGR